MSHLLRIRPLFAPPSRRARRTGREGRSGWTRRGGRGASPPGGPGCPTPPPSSAAGWHRRSPLLRGAALGRASPSPRGAARRSPPQRAGGGGRRGAVAPPRPLPLRPCCPALGGGGGLSGGRPRAAGGRGSPPRTSIASARAAAWGICLPGRGRRQGKGQQEKQLLQIKKGKEKIKRGSFVGHLQSSAPRQASESK